MHPIDQVTKQLHKLVNVIKIRDLEPAETVARELALFKVTADGPARGEVMQIVEIFRGKIIDVTRRSLIIEVTGHLGEGRGVRAHGASVRPRRDGPHGRDRDLARPQRDLMRALGAAALLVLAWPATAAAADCGGGTSAHQRARLPRPADDREPSSRRRARDGPVIVRALVAGRLRRRGHHAARVAVAADGSFAIADDRARRAPEDRGVRRIAVVTVSGRIVGTVATGTASARVRLVRRGRDRGGAAPPGSRVWQARGRGRRGRAPAPPRPPGGYFGLTGDTRRPHAFVLRVDAAGAARRRPRRSSTRWTCRSRRVEADNITPGGRIAGERDVQPARAVHAALRRTPPSATASRSTGASRRRASTGRCR